LTILSISLYNFLITPFSNCFDFSSIFNCSTIDSIVSLLGFKYSTIAGITVSAADIVPSKTKHQVIDEGNALVEKINKQYKRGLITEEERFAKVIETWNSAKDQVQAELEEISNSDVDNPIFMMMHSKARGNISNFTQVAGMRGIMAKPSGESVEIPVLSNFKEG